MPTRVVDITLSTETAAAPEDTANNAVIVAAADTAPPNANFGEANEYSAADDVETDYGVDSDPHIASEALEEMGVRSWHVLLLEATETTETLADGDTATNAPILGDPAPTAAAGNLSFVAGDPNTGGLDAGEHELNTDTGEVATGDADVDITYQYVDWSQLDVALEGLGTDIIFRGDMRMQREHVGTLDEIVSWADSHEAAVVAAHMNGANATDEQEAMDTAHAIGGYVQSGSLLTFAHKSSEDAAAYVVGQCANEVQWFDPFYDEDGYPFDTGYYRDSNVGSPDEAGTFEGGDASNQDGPTNVIIEKADRVVLSNSLTTAGSDTDYQYWDIRRTEDYAQGQVEQALTELRLEQDRIPFTREGRALIGDAIRGAFSGDVGGVDDPFADLEVYVPTVDTLTEEQRTDRIWSGITIEATLSGNVHEFALEMNVSV